jgi:hypothetical protein
MSKSLTQELQQAAQAATDIAETLESLAQTGFEWWSAREDREQRHWISVIRAAANRARKLAKRLDHDAVP